MPHVPRTTVTVPLSPPQAVPETSASLYLPPSGSPLATVVLGHSAGSGPDSDVLVAVARSLAERGAAVLSFAFPYRAAGRRLPDPAPRLLSAWRDAVTVALGHGPAPLVLGGRSMGGRMASMLLAEDAVPPLAASCVGLVLLAYPLVGQGRKPTLRTEHWPHIRVPALFVSGDRDAMCDVALLERERPRLGAPSDLVVLRGADHSFNVLARNGRTRRDVLRETAAAVTDWVAARAGLDVVNAGGGQ
jgi:predicted alpha/beta-hydrolase family hydrolase